MLLREAIRCRRPAAWPLLVPLAVSLAVALAACGGHGSGDPGGGTCSNGVKDGDETDVDCGGSCGKCADGKACGVPADCASGVCAAAVCAAPTCFDGVQNGGEAGVDCGGPCAPCGSGVACTSGAQCASGVCLAGACDCGDATSVYVSAANGNDAAAGTLTAPLRTIQAAVACAYKVPREIRVAEGTYLSSSASRILLVDGKSLVGGWSGSFGEWNPAAHFSTIQDTTDTGNAATPTAAAIVVAASSSATRIEGFRIQATTTGAGQVVSAIQFAPPQGLAGAGIRGNVIQCGGNASVFIARCIDLATSNASLVITGNEIHLGASSYLTRAIHGDSVGATQVSGNSITGGSGPILVGIELTPSASNPTTPFLVDANDIRLGAGNDAQSAAVRLSGGAASVRNNVVLVTGGAIGLDDGAGAEVSNNTVVASTGPGIRLRAPGASVRNNALSQAGGTCVAEVASADPVSVQANDLFGCATPYLLGATALALGDLNAWTAVVGSWPNLSVDPSLDAAKGYRPQVGSPLLGKGLGLSSLFTNDRSGATRTAPWTIGAYQSP